MVGYIVLTVVLVSGIAACGGPTYPATPPVARIAFLDDVSPSDSGEALQSICLAAFKRVLAYAAETQGTVTVELIDGNPLVNSRTPIDVRFAVPEQFSNNPIYASPILEQQQRTATRELEALLEAPPTTHGTDILGALELAERILTRPPLGPMPERRFLVVCSDLLNSQPPVDFYRQPPSEEEIPGLIQDLRESGQLPTGLAGARVYLIGAGQPTAGRVSLRQARSVETFYRMYFEAVGASIASYGATLPRFP